MAVCLSSRCGYARCPIEANGDQRAFDTRQYSRQRQRIVRLLWKTLRPSDDREPEHKIKVNEKKGAKKVADET